MKANRQQRACHASWIACIVVIFSATFAHAVLTTNSYTSTFPAGAWDFGPSWSAGVAPGIGQSCAIISNGVAKTVLIVDATTNSSLTVSNLIVRAPGGPPVNTLSISTTNSFTVLQNITIGLRGALTVSNAVVDVKGLNGGFVINNGFITINNGATFLATNALSGLDIGHSGFGTLTMNGGRMVIMDEEVGTFPGDVGTLTIAGGTNVVLNDGMFIADNANCTGTVWMTGGALIETNSTIFVGNLGSGTLTVSNGTLMARTIKVANGGTGVLNLFGGIATVTSNLIVGISSCAATGTVKVNGGSLFITNATTNAVCDIRSGTLQLDSGTLSIDSIIITNPCGSFTNSGGTFIATGPVEFDQGESSIGGGTNQMGSNIVVGASMDATGVVNVVGGAVLVATNGVLGIGNNGVLAGVAGFGVMNISNAVVVANNVLMGSGGGGAGQLVLNAAGELRMAAVACAACGLVASDVILNGGAIEAANARFFAGQNHPGQMTISNGVARFRSAYVGFDSTGTLTILGGTMTVSSNMVVGDCGASVTGRVTIAGGSLYVTNAAHDAVLDLRDGSLLLNSGTLVIDTLVMTNACAQFIKAGGALSITTTNISPNLDADGDGIPNAFELDPFDPADAALDPDGDGFSNLQEFLAGTNPTNNASSFHVTSITQVSGTNLLVAWMTGVGKTNALEKVLGGMGSFTNNFTTVFIVTNTVGTVTNYLDVGAVGLNPARYYRVRLAP